MDHSDSLSTHLNEHLTGKMSVTIEVTDRNHESSQVMIPITPQADHYNEMDYGEDKETPAETEPVPTESVSPETAPTENQETGAPAESSRAESVPAVTAPTEPAPIQETQPPAALPETWPDDDDGQTDYEDSDDGQTDYGDRDDGQTDYGDDDDDDDGDDD